MSYEDCEKLRNTKQGVPATHYPCPKAIVLTDGGYTAAAMGKTVQPAQSLELDNQVAVNSTNCTKHNTPSVQEFDSNNRSQLVLKQSNHLKHAIKSKSLDLFDRPSHKKHLTRVKSLTTMSSIPEDFPSSIYPAYNEEDMPVTYRSPVSIDNGYRPAASVAGKTDRLQYTVFCMLT